MIRETTPPHPAGSFDQSALVRVRNFLLTWTPRAAAGVVGGYYVLGFAYTHGWIEIVNRIAIKILYGEAPKSFWQHVSRTVLTGAAMEQVVTPYTQWAFRIVGGLVFGAAYDFLERVICLGYRTLLQVLPERSEALPRHEAGPSQQNLDFPA